MVEHTQHNAKKNQTVKTWLYADELGHHSISLAP